MSEQNTTPSDDSAPTPQPPEASDNTDHLTLGQMFGSALAAMIGVQSKEKRERDFARGKASHFIIVGVVLTAAFVLVMAGIVTFIMSLVT
jgi:hypothetical protein